MSNLPSVTMLCPTYGRTFLLEESIESFIRQDYPGNKYLIVLNDLAEQKLILPNCPGNIQIINVRERFPDLGAKKNALARMASSDLITNMGDDDICLPHRISENVRAFSSGKCYVREGVFFGDEAMKYKSPIGPFMMARAEYLRVGGIPNAETGEDRKFLNLVLKDKFEVAYTRVASYMARRTTGRYHTSGSGHSRVWDGIREDVQKTLRSGAEPSGDVTLTPQWRRDYVMLATELARKAADSHWKKSFLDFIVKP